MARAQSKKLSKMARAGGRALYCPSWKGLGIEKNEIGRPFEKANYSTSSWASTDKAFKGFPYSLINLNWKDVLVCWWTGSLVFVLYSFFFFFSLSFPSMYYLRTSCPLCFLPVFSINKN